MKHKTLIFLGGMIFSQVVHAEFLLKDSVDRYILAPRGEVEGILLKDGTSVSIGLTKGRDIVKNLKPGDKVTVKTAQDVSKPAPEGRGIKAISVQNDKTGEIVIPEERTSPPSKPVSATSKIPDTLSAKGQIEHYIYNELGEIEGAFLSDRKEVRIPAHLREKLLEMIRERPKAILQANGAGVVTRYGTVLDGASLKYDGKKLE